jgi:hypothetical protein
MKEDSEDNERMMVATGLPSQKLYWLARLMHWRVCTNLPKAISIT